MCIWPNFWKFKISAAPITKYIFKLGGVSSMFLNFSSSCNKEYIQVRGMFLSPSNTIWIAHRCIWWVSVLPRQPLIWRTLPAPSTRGSRLVRNQAAPWRSPMRTWQTCSQENWTHSRYGGQWACYGSLDPKTNDPSGRRLCRSVTETLFVRISQQSLTAQTSFLQLYKGMICLCSRRNDMFVQSKTVDLYVAWGLCSQRLLTYSHE